MIDVARLIDLGRGAELLRVHVLRLPGGVTKLLGPVQVRLPAQSRAR